MHTIKILEKPIRPGSIFSYLLSAASENHGTIADTLEKFLTDRINFGEESEALLALEITSYLDWHHDIEGFNTWEHLADKIFDNCSTRIATLCSKHFSACSEAIQRGRAHISDLIEWYGFESLFRRTYFTLFPRSYLASPAVALVSELRSVLYPSKSSWKFIGWIDALKEVGRSSFSYQPPWVHYHSLRTKARLSDLGILETFSSWPSEENAQYDVLGKQIELDSEAYFGIFVLFAISLESFPKEEVTEEEIIERLQTHPHAFFDPFRWVLIARFVSQAMDKVQETMDYYGFTIQQQRFIWRWIRKEFDLVQRETSHEDLPLGGNGDEVHELSPSEPE